MALSADALPCLAALRTRGLRLGAAGNMRAVHEEFLRRHVDFVGSSDPVDNDVIPALAAGLRAARVRRGAHAAVESPAGTVTIDSLDELPETLDRV
jgi:FMN phosphatase YigB (HAD superfamily)